MRIALAFSALFFVGGFVILSLVFVLVRQDLLNPKPAVISTDDDSAQHEDLEREVRATVREQALRSLLIRSGGALVVLTVASGAAGWMVAGVVLRPVHRITDVARRASASKLEGRVHLAGPDDELKELADTFDGMLDRLEASVDAQRRFAANAAHELRTPLTIIRTATEIGLSSSGPAAPALVEEAAADIRSATADAERLIDGLLELARSEHGAQRREQIDVAERVSESVAQCRGLARHRGIDVELCAQPGLILGDPTLIDLAVNNLLANAVRYGRADGTISVRTATTAGTVVIDVVSDGDSLTTAQVEAFRQPFVRGDGVRQGAGHEGVGLGLSIVDAVARAHAGSLDLTPRSAGGLAVHLRLRALPRQ